MKMLLLVLTIVAVGVSPIYQAKAEKASPTHQKNMQRAAGHHKCKMSGKCSY
jgi:hypothetical protein